MTLTQVARLWIMPATNGRFEMTQVALLDDYQGIALKMGAWESLGPDVRVTAFHQNFGTQDAAAAALAPFDVIVLMRERMPMPASLIARLPNLKLIISTGMVNRSLDSAAARERGIVCCGTTGGDTTASTTETAWALMLGAARKLVYEDRRMRAGHWQSTIGTILAGKTLGILGLGKLGSRMASVAQAFGMKTIAWSQNLTAEKAAAAGTELVSKDELFARADFITIHLVLSDRSRGLVGVAEFARMKPSAVLINTSRGPIVDERAMIAALEENRIGGVGLDVYDVEPLPADHRLRQLDNAVLSPHLGYVSDGTYREYFRDIVDDIAQWRAGTPVRLVG
jgi:phosphoglycerate dehydrogenase-like enzyme